MKNVMALSIISLMFLSLTGFKSAETNKLIVEVSNFENKGSTRLQVSVFSRANFLEKPIQTKSVIVSGKKVMVAFDLPQGEYAVSTYQDINDNNELDRYFFGKPKEPYGFSNNVKSLGPPKYDKCRFTIGAQPKTISIRLFN